MSPDGKLYLSRRKESSDDMEVKAHSAFLGGKQVVSTGMTHIEIGKILGMNTMSGHYEMQNRGRISQKRKRQL